MPTDPIIDYKQKREDETIFDELLTKIQSSGVELWIKLLST